MNQKKFRGWCTNSCGDLIKSGATKFCSWKCQHDFYRKLRAKDLESGSYFAMQTTKFLRKYLVQRLGDRCSRCGWAERYPVTQRVSIEVEHIDGNWRNYRLDNLTLLCPNCHSLTPTFRGLNRGRGRAHRLGGRENPLALSQLQSEPRARATLQKVFEPPSRQLQLLTPT